MNAFAAAGGGFLVAVLWFDLMFDLQTAKHRGALLPAEVLASISAYYRRVTTEARPMNQLIPAVMVLTVLVLVMEIVRRAYPAWILWPSLALALAGIGLALARTVRNAARLGTARDTLASQTRLARTIYRDHLFCFASMALLVGVQLAATS